VRFADVAARYLVAYRVKRDGTARPKSSLAKERTCLNVYILPALGNAWIGDLDLPELNAAIRHLTLQDGSPASGSTKTTVASVLRRLFAWAQEERIIPANPRARTAHRLGRIGPPPGDHSQHSAGAPARPGT
jgi:hypothetical protein